MLIYQYTFSSCTCTNTGRHLVGLVQMMLLEQLAPCPSNMYRSFRGNKILLSVSFKNWPILNYSDTHLEEADFTESKASLRSFIRQVVISGEKATIHYNLPMPPDGKKRQSVGVPPVVTPGGAGGIRTPYLLTASQTLSRLSYSPANIFYYLLDCFSYL